MNSVWLQRGIRLAALAAVGGVVSVLTIACGSTGEPGAQPGEPQEAGTVPGEDAQPTADGSVPFEAGPFLDAGPCIPKPVDCTGKCGPVRDPCSGEVKMCGGCPTGQVCDLQAHTCGVPKVKCEDFGAECGQIKTSCGEYKFCGSCPAGKECNPDTNKCQAAQTVTCQDLGYECGVAWLGSGDPNAKTNCGTCQDPARPRCNSAFNLCEPVCVPGQTGPKTPAEKKKFCDAAKASRGVQCGIISDGCGGTVDCSPVAGFTCPAGQGCGVRGVGNRCEPFPTPPECEALGKNCGELVSVCTGKKIECGKCNTAAGDVCNDNGVCGPPCTLKTCTAALAPGQECGNPSDGCKSTLDCKCPAGKVCQSNKCCQPKTCQQLLAGTGNTCGRNLDNGCGGTVDCPCPGGSTQTCLDTGGSAVSNNEQGACCVRKTCLGDYAGQCGTGLTDGCGGTLNCGCNGANQTCITGTAPAGTTPPTGVAGTCCNESGCNAALGECNKTVTSVCTGAPTTCSNCPPGQTVCNGTTCCAPVTCGNQCNVTLDNCGTPLNCGDCAFGTCTGNVCVCTPLTCADYPPGTCGNNLSNGCGGTISCGTPKTCADFPGACGRQDNQCGGLTARCDPCPAGQVCQVGGGCCTRKTCADFPGQCGNNLDDGCGGTVDCSCGTNGLPAGVCIVGAAPGSAAGNGVAGSCCAETTCTATAGQCNKVVPSACIAGQNLPACSNCTAAQTSCNGGVCCQPLTCTSPANAGKCGTIINGTGCGQNLVCNCSGAFNTCGGGGTPGVCGCTKKTCADYPGKVGPQPDGCGGVTAACTG